jgi:hypothetical protein
MTQVGLYGMWGLMLKYCLEVRERSSGDVAVFASCCFHGRSLRGLSEVSLAWPACLVAMLSPWG